MARELEVGRWKMRFALYGDEAVVDHRFRKVKEAFERIPGAEVWGEKHAPDAFADAREPARAGPGRGPEPRHQHDDRVVRRRQGGQSRRAEPWAVTDAPETYVEKQLRAIVGLELTIERVEGKAKLSQNRSEEDRAGVVAGLRAEGGARESAVAEQMERLS